ncbi:MAG: class I SAM-dependent methyltransferase [Acidobacteriota bacterium]|nr:class I SAM-dependent methyltransferase [Acidobacteriota bacterium]
MFEQITPAMLARMQELEAIDLRDRDDGTPHSRRLRQVPEATGRFLGILAASAPEGAWLEIGTSAGYSTLWLAMAARRAGRRVTTFEFDPGKCALARATFDTCGVNDVIDLVAGDALMHLATHDGIGFCFLDAEKDIYQSCFDLVVPRLVKGGLLAADNVISHQQALRPMLDQAQRDERVDSVIVPIGQGVLLCRKK